MLVMYLLKNKNAASLVSNSTFLKAIIFFCFIN
jgi:hypothetical protein